jgi:hypothetical protein
MKTDLQTKGKPMASYPLPKITEPDPVPAKTVVMVASGDLRRSAN